MKDENNRIFDHRREYAHTDWDHHSLPRKNEKISLPNRANSPTKPASTGYRFRCNIGTKRFQMAAAATSEWP